MPDIEASQSEPGTSHFDIEASQPVGPMSQCLPPDIDCHQRRDVGDCEAVPPRRTGVRRNNESARPWRLLGGPVCASLPNSGRSWDSAAHQPPFRRWRTGRRGGQSGPRVRTWPRRPISYFATPCELGSIGEPLVGRIPARDRGRGPSFGVQLLLIAVRPKGSRALNRIRAKSGQTFAESPSEAYLRLRVARACLGP